MGFFVPDVDALESWRVRLSRAGHRGMHNFSFGTITTYFGLISGTAEWLDDCVLHVISPQGKHKTWVFDVGEVLPDHNLLTGLRRLGPIYSQVELRLPGIGSFEELAYDLDRVLDPTSYPNNKKRYQRLTYPARWMERYGYSIRMFFKRDTSEVQILHDLWVEHKLSQESTYRLMFPRKRYLDCFRVVAERPDLGFFGFVLLDSSGAIVGARALYAEAGTAFDLAQFVRPGLPSDAAECFAFLTMKTMHKLLGVTRLNCGASLNGPLKAFKSHWPHEQVRHWSYPRTR